MRRPSLSNLLEATPDAEIDGGTEIEVTGVECDSRCVTPGTIFVAVRGWQEDGHRYLPQAVDAGACAIVSSTPRQDRAGGVTWVRVADERPALARLARRFHGYPDLELTLVGVTGTKGKTTTAWLIESMIEASGGKPGGTGTIRTRIGDQNEISILTTPDAPTLCAQLTRMVEEKCTHAVLEASSQALHQSRVESLRFRCAVFTNFTQDHLDYHKTLEAYFESKARLFRSLDADAVAVLPADDPHAERLARLTEARVVTYAVGHLPSTTRERWWAVPEVRVESAQVSLGSTTAVLRTPRGSIHTRMPLTGRHNLRNLAAAATTAWSLDLPDEAIASGAARVEPVPGRMESIDEGQSFLVIVDFAHTEDALSNALSSLRELTRGRLLCVFGCGGDRDRSKRAPMGAAAAAAADRLYLTSDNPRREDPLAILRDIELGVKQASPERPYQVIPDRAAAISAAMSEARQGDAVLIAGKGHEREQLVADRRLPFDDREQARISLRALSGGRMAEGE